MILTPALPHSRMAALFSRTPARPHARTLFLILLFIFSTVQVYAQTGSVYGKVNDNGTPFPSVNILIIDTRLGTVTDENGNYEINNLGEGDYRIRFSAVGYESLFFDVKITGGKRVQLDVEMKSAAIEFGEVEVTGQRRQRKEDTRTSLIDLNPRTAKTLPGAVEDVMRTLQSLPGVLAPNDFSSQLIIRGSGPDQNLIIMDDIEVFNPYRFYGVISMFNPDAVSDVNLISGGFPARYGDRLSAVLDVTNREGNTKKNFTGSLNASIIDANLVLEGKNPLNIPGSWILNSRRTYYDLIIEPFVKNAGLVEENVSFPNFYDIQGKLVFGPFGNHKFLINGIHSRDGVDIISGSERESPDSISVFNETTNDIAGLSWHYVPSSKLLNKLTLSWYRNRGVADFDSRILDPSLDRERFEEIQIDTISIYLLNVNFNTDFVFEKYSFDNRLTYYWGENNTFEAGFGADFVKSYLDLEFNIDPQLKALISGNPQAAATFDDIDDLKKYTRFRIYTENNFALSEKFFLHPGIRVDYYDVLEKVYFSPRISASWALDNTTTLRGVWGTYYQSPGYEKVLDQSSLLDLDKAYTRELDAENSLHYILGIERWLTSEWNLRLEGYYKDFRDLIVQQKVSGTRYFTEPIPGRDPYYLSGWSAPIGIKGDSTTQVPVNGSYGEAYGFEVLLAKRNVSVNTPFSGWISFSHAYANRFDYGEEFPFRFDQRNTVNVVLNYQVNSWFNAGLRWQYGSGFPYTEPAGIKPRIYFTDTDLDGEPDSPLIATRKNSAGENEIIYDVDYGEQKLNSRKPPYHRLDVRLTFLTNFWSLDWTFYLDVINVYNRKNVIGYDYDITPDLQLDREETTMLPIIPTIGLSVKF